MSVSTPFFNMGVGRRAFSIRAQARHSPSLINFLGFSVTRKHHAPFLSVGMVDIAPTICQQGHVGKGASRLESGVCDEVAPFDHNMERLTLDG